MDAAQAAHDALPATVQKGIFNSAMRMYNAAADASLKQAASADAHARQSQNVVLAGCVEGGTVPVVVDCPKGGCDGFTPQLDNPHLVACLDGYAPDGVRRPGDKLAKGVKKGTSTLEDNIEFLRQMGAERMKSSRGDVFAWRRKKRGKAQ